MGINMAANLDFNMRFRAQTAEFSRAIAQINQELAQLRQSIGGSFGSLNTLGARSAQPACVAADGVVAIYCQYWIEGGGFGVVGGGAGQSLARGVVGNAPNAKHSNALYLCL